MTETRVNQNGAVAMLMQEHRAILAVVEGLGRVAAVIRDGGTKIAPALLEDAVSFMRDYADRFHHAKEEDLLFPALVGHGVPLHGCPIDALLHEHRRGRELVGALAAGLEARAAGDPGAGPALAETIEAMVALYTNHIWKEDQMVFPMAERLLPVEDLMRLDTQCRAVAQSFPEGAQTRFEEFASRFAAATAAT